jgi:hypothetical protein
MPHESTVNPYDYISDDYGNLRRVGKGYSQMSLDSNSAVAGTPVQSDMATLTRHASAMKVTESNETIDLANLKKPETPSVLTHHEDFDDDDEESDESKGSVTINSSALTP